MNKLKIKIKHHKLFKQKFNYGDKFLNFFCYNRLNYFIRHIYRFLNRLPKYIRLAWEQETWDYEYLYNLIEMKLKEFLKAQEEDTWHVEKETKRRIKQIKICLAYLDRYRNWDKYYTYPVNDLRFEPTENGCSIMVHDSTYNEIKRKGLYAYQKFYYDMFWKRFLQWHQKWWV